MRELSAANVMRHFANVCGTVATAGDLTRVHVENVSVAAHSVNGVLLPVAVAVHLTEATARLVQQRCVMVQVIQSSSR